jgi:cell division protein FtsB
MDPWFVVSWRIKRYRKRGDRMKQTVQYQYGTAAKKLKTSQLNTENKKVNTPETTRRIRSSVPKGLLFMGIILSVTMCFIVVNRYSVIAEMNFQMSQMNSDYHTLRESNNLKKVEIETSLNLGLIRSQAENELGMHEPDLNQVVNVNVPVSSYSVILNQDYIEQATNEDSSIFGSAAKIFSSIFP